jgi:hypothetical protein
MVVKYMIVDEDSRVFENNISLVSSLGFDVRGFLFGDLQMFLYNLEEMPKIVQLDSLGGRCFELYEYLFADNPDAHYFVFSSNGSLAFENNVLLSGMEYLLNEGGFVLEDYLKKFL